MANETDIQLAAHHEVRERILEAAEELFASKGFDATSISDIADAADAGRALIYYYFKDKRDLYDSVLQDGGDRIFAIANNAYAFEGTAFDRLRQFMTQFRQLHVDRPNLAHVAMRAQFEDSLAFHEHAEEGFAKVLSVLRRIVEEGVAQGELRSIDPEKTIHMLMGMVHSLVIMQIHEGSGSTPEEDLESAMSILTYGIASQE